MQLRPQSDALDISVVLPVYNERENLEPLIAEIASALESIPKRFEIIAVDDKSSDGSLDKLQDLEEERPHLRVLAHRANFGQSAALATGIAHARGNVVITLDADRQNDPATIPLLLKTLKNDIDAVCGIRMGRQDTWVRKVSSRIANRFRNWVTGDRIADAGCTFRAIRREALRDLPVFNGMHRFLPTLLRYQGYTVIEIPVNHRPRVWGESKYGIRNRLWRGLRDCFGIRWFKKRALPGERVDRQSEK